MYPPDSTPAQRHENDRCVKQAIQAVQDAMACLAPADLSQAIWVLQGAIYRAHTVPKDTWNATVPQLLSQLELLIIAEPLWRVVQNARAVERATR